MRSSTPLYGIETRPNYNDMQGTIGKVYSMVRRALTIRTERTER